MEQKFDKAKFAKEAMAKGETPLDNWSKDVDPAIMAGDEWVDKELELRIPPQMGLFMHPMYDVSYGQEEN